eukprot:COSAG02_NODE_2623_length_8399_cov_21.197590_2_plen_96_part_00
MLFCIHGSSSSYYYELYHSAANVLLQTRQSDDGLTPDTAVLPTVDRQTGKGITCSWLAGSPDSLWEYYPLGQEDLGRTIRSGIWYPLLFIVHSRT